MRFEVMVRDTNGLRVFHEGDTGSESVTDWASRCQADPTTDYAGVAVEGVHGHLWAAGDVQAYVLAGRERELVGAAVVRQWGPAVREVLRGMSPGESVTVSEVARKAGAPTEVVRGAVAEAVAAGYADRVNEDGSRVARSVWEIPPG